MDKKFEILIKDSIESVSNDVDYTTVIMKQINDNKYKPKTFVLQKTLIVIAIILLFTTTVYASMSYFGKSHFDAHVDRAELFKMGDRLSCNPEWEDKSFVVIDTEAIYPFNVDIRPMSENFGHWDGDIVLDEEMSIIPLKMGNFIVSNVGIHYNAEIPSKSEVKEMVKNHDGERFVVEEIETGDVRSISYRIENNKHPDLYFSVWVELIIDDNQYIEKETRQHEFIDFDDVTFKLAENEYTGLSYVGDDIIKSIAENHYSVTWYEPDKEYNVYIRPRIDDFEEREIVEVDGQKTTLTIYPKDTNEIVIELAKLIHVELKK